MKAKITFRIQTGNDRYLKRPPFVKGIALKNKLQLINSQQPNKGSILDIGAGTGDFGVAKENGWETVGVEPSDKARAIALKSSFICEDTSSWKVILLM
jgi:predicted RNA methylase